MKCRGRPGGLGKHEKCSAQHEKPVLIGRTTALDCARSQRIRGGLREVTVGALCPAGHPQGHGLGEMSLEIVAYAPRGHS